MGFLSLETERQTERQTERERKKEIKRERKRERMKGRKEKNRMRLVIDRRPLWEGLALNVSFLISFFSVLQIRFIHKSVLEITDRRKRRQPVKDLLCGEASTGFCVTV